MQASNSASSVVAHILRKRGVERVFGLCGGHIMPIWMKLDAEGVSIVGVRDERAAVHMAQAHAEITGQLGVAMVTAGPGVTNAMTGIANAYVSRTPVLIVSGRPPMAQTWRGALQDMDHPAMVNSITRYARTIADPTLVPRELDEAIARALGEGGEPGPSFIEFPTDVLRAQVPEVLVASEYLTQRPKWHTLPDPSGVARAAELLLSARRPLVISGRGARNAGRELVDLLDKLDPVYLDTGESRGLVPDDHPAVVAAMRATVMREADLVLTVGRKLDFQLAYGSPAVFSAKHFIRLADTAAELRDNRRGTVELLAEPADSLAAIVKAVGNRMANRDREWLDRVRAGHRQRAGRLNESMHTAPNGSDGRMHPNRVLAAIRDRFGSNAIAVVDGGDILSFARVGLAMKQMLDPGPLGCLGVGVPYGIAASLARPDTPVIVVTGDGAFGFNAIELDTAARTKAPVIFVVANNGAWQIEAHDQQVTYGKINGTQLQFSDYAAMARAFGVHGERVTRSEDLPDALERAIAHRPSLLDVEVTPEAVSSDAKTGLAVVPDLQPLAAWDNAEREWRAGKTRVIAPSDH